MPDNINIKNRIRSISFPYLLFLLVLPASGNSDMESFDKINILIKGTEYSLEVAKTQSQRSQGLMFRQSLGKKEGMLFVYPRSGDHRIWMKNTLIPLTVVWLDRNESVIAVKQLQPCDTDFCPSFGSSRSSKYIIELNAEFQGIDLGDKIIGLKLIE